MRDGDQVIRSLGPLRRDLSARRPLRRAANARRRSTMRRRPCRWPAPCRLRRPARRCSPLPPPVGAAVADDDLAGDADPPRPGKSGTERRCRVQCRRRRSAPAQRPPEKPLPIRLAGRAGAAAGHVDKGVDAPRPAVSTDGRITRGRDWLTALTVRAAVAQPDRVADDVGVEDRRPAGRTAPSASPADARRTG